MDALKSSFTGDISLKSLKMFRNLIIPVTFSKLIIPNEKKYYYCLYYWNLLLK